LHSYVDPGSPGRQLEWTPPQWSSTGKAGVQIWADWAKGEFLAAKQT